MYHKTDVAKVLIDEHKRLNETFLCECDVTGYNALIYSSQFGHLETVEQLLPIYIKYEKVTTQNNQGSSALHLSAQKGHTPIVRILVEHFAKQNKIEDKDYGGWTALALALDDNHEDIIDILNEALESD